MRARTVFALSFLVASIFLIAACASTDVGLTTKVKAKLADDELVRASQINVTTNGGVVTLEGNVDSERAKARALELARGTEGVVNVVDRISARTAEGRGDAPETGRTVGERIDDAQITMSVKAKMADDETVKARKIDVDTREGVVYLTGTVRSDAERDRAIQLARETEGVVNVEANLTIGEG